MGYGLIIGKQIVIMFIILLLGVICSKCGMITKDGTKQLSAVELNLVNPLLIFMSYQKDCTPKLMKGLLWSFLLSAICFAVAMISAKIFVRKGRADCGLERCSVIYSNCGFIGIPLINSIYGSTAVLYLTAYITCFNFLVWTHGYMTMKGERDFSSLKKALRSSSVIAVFVGLACFLLKIRLPEIPSSAIQYVVDMNTPLAMLIAGATVAQTNLLKSLKNLGTWGISMTKLVFIPLLCLVAIAFIPAPKIIQITVLIATACPTATTCTMFAVTMDKNPERCSEFFASTTILSAITLPLMVTIGEKLL